MVVQDLVGSWKVNSFSPLGLRPSSGAVATLAVLLAAAVTPLHAQGAGVIIAPRVGFSLPAGQFSSYVDPGPTAGLRLGYRVAPRVNVFADGGLDFLGGSKLYRGLANEISAPDIKTKHVMAGVEGQLVGEESRMWSVLGSLGGGILSLDSDPFTVDGEQRDFEHTGPLAAAGLEIGRAISGRLSVVLDTKLYWALMDKDDTAELAAVGPSRLEPMGSALTVPVTLVLRTRL